jgi:hypothetical protein
LMVNTAQARTLSKWHYVVVVVEGVLEWNQIPSPMGQAPKIHNALARISTTHLYAPIRTSAHLYAPYALCAGHLGAFLNPGLASFFFSLLQNSTRVRNLD